MSIEMHDKTGQAPSVKDVEEAETIIRRMIVTSMMMMPPELAVQCPNIHRCLLYLREIMPREATPPLPVRLENVWIEYEEDAGRWHMMGLQGLRCGRSFNRGLNGPQLQPPADATPCQECVAIVTAGVAALARAPQPRRSLPARPPRTGTLLSVGRKRR